MISETHRAFLWLTTSKSITRGVITKILEKFDPVELMYHLEDHKDALTKDIGVGAYNSLKVNNTEALHNHRENAILEKGIDLISMYDDDYPDCFKNIQDYPVMLYVRGNKSLLDTPSISIVGSRELTRYGQTITQTFATALAEVGFTIVSGLARGVDSIAHEAAIKSGGNTIAVLGCGIDVVYPAENAYLYKSIIQNGGLIISEYPLGDKAQYYHFPERNRLIAALSRGVLVTEARLNSGSLITARLAIDYGRELFVVPGNITSKYSEGCNRLLKEVQGAIVTCTEDILTALGVTQKRERPSSIQLDFSEEKIVERLEKGEAHFEELLAITELPVTTLMSVLSKLEIFGIIKKLTNNLYGV